MQNIHDLLRGAEHITDVLEQVIGHEPPSDHFTGTNLARQGQHALSIKLDHLTVFVLTQHGKEVQQPTDVLLVFVKRSFTASSTGIQIIGALLENGQRTRRVEVEHVGVLLA